ncbi:hypothetical protein CBM2589_A90509 [Cupriavidus taiwanensis]|uniref:Uncharacterized protein n=1 Tax=Cupriavidus taiwanensis TaxID=164546 RepID=A0A975XGC1_9BURK|nr:hypothetical protein CBM2589_A90509 [Cupriavidus taiwanensis]
MMRRPSPPPLSASGRGEKTSGPRKPSMTSDPLHYEPRTPDPSPPSNQKNPHPTSHNFVMNVTSPHPTLIQNSHLLCDATSQRRHP